VYGRLHRRLLDRRSLNARAGWTTARSTSLIGEDARAASNNLTALLQIGFARVASQCDVLDLEPPRCPGSQHVPPPARSALTGCVVERNPAPQGPTAPHEKHILMRPMRWHQRAYSRRMPAPARPSAASSAGGGAPACSGSLSPPRNTRTAGACVRLTKAGRGPAGGPLAPLLTHAPRRLSTQALREVPLPVASARSPSAPAGNSPTLVARRCALMRSHRSIGGLVAGPPPF
jgi:hypothetical protein